MKLETEIRVMWPQGKETKDSQEPHKAGRNTEGFSPRAFRRTMALSTLDFELQVSRNMRE